MQAERNLKDLTSETVKTKAMSTPPVAANAPAGESVESGAKNVKSLKLISVSFKEAALDSPTFRAYVNHSFDQVDRFAQWIDTLRAAKRDYAAQYEVFQESLYSIKNLFQSTSPAEELIDSDYTSADLNFTMAGYEEIMVELLKFAAPNNEVDQITNDLVQHGLLEFNKARRNFESVQSMHDLVLSRYCSLPKTMEPSAVRDDAYQLAEIRKQYISVSLDIDVAITDFARAANNYLIEIVTLMWRTNLDLNVHTKNYNSFNKYVERIARFQKVSNTSMDRLRQDMIDSKDQTAESTLKQHSPSDNLKDYNIAAINPSSLLRDFTEPFEEKHGWLFMKTNVGKPSRQAWVRRWCFVKDGIFGMFSLSPSKTFVQELDKFGIGLCNVRYCPEEERRYCFEFKTITNTVIFQAENLQQLKSWLNIFAKSKSAVMEMDQPQYFTRYPPLLKEFANTASTTTDAELTTIEKDTHGIDSLIDTISIPFEIQLLSTIYNAPISTAASKESVAAHGVLSPTTIPTAATANIWGSVNWGNYYLSQQFHPKEHGTRSAIPTANQQLLNEESFRGRYPQYYPKKMIPFDCQLRALLGSSFPQGEYVLIEFRAIWVPNSKQELVGRCYVTQNHIFFYMNSLGFVSLMRREMNQVISFENISDDDFDILKIYEIGGSSMKAKLYLDSGKLLRDQMNALLANNLSKTPKSLQELIKEVERLRTIHTKQEIERLKTNYQSKKEVIPSVITTTSNVRPTYEIKTNYNREMKLIWDKIYDIPSKALFHCLIGDDSFILQKILPLIDSKNENISNTLWTQIEQQKLKRSFMTDTIFDTNEFRTTRIDQTIENMINSKYYNIVQRSQYFKFPGLNAYRVITRVVIYSLNLNNSKLLIYSKIQFDDRERYQMKFLNFFNGHFLNSASRHKVETLDADIKSAISKIGSHGKVAKAIRLYGQISRSEAPQKIKENDEIMILSFGALIRAMVRKFFSDMFSILWFFIGSIIAFFKSLQVNYFLILLLGLSVGYNLLLTARSGISYWVVSRADNTMNEYMGDKTVSRAVYLKDLQDLVGSNYKYPESQCFDKFKDNSVILNHNLAIENPLKQTMQQLGKRRNKLLIDLKLVNDLERHLVDLEWDNFLNHEIERCSVVNSLNISEEADLSQLQNYCASCRHDLDDFSQVSNLL